MPMVITHSDLRNVSLSEAARLVGSKEVSPVELVDCCLERIAAVNDRLKAYITVYDEQARQVARAAEAMIIAGHRLGPLHGVPIALKDNIALQGLRTTAGSKVLADWVPDEDATVAARLKGAGAIFIGKTNMHEFAWGGTTDNPHYGTCRNPWDDERFPAGSSGGSGVAVAARTCYGALGTDTGGSIRLPSAINGIVGIRPTIGRVSNHGVIPLAWSMDTVGPMARSVEDCALMFNVIAGHDPVRHALATLEGLGATVVDVEIAPIHGNISAQLTIEAAEPSTYHQGWLRERPDAYGDDVRSLLEIGERLLATHYIQAQRYRRLLRREFLDAFKSVDVFICPSLPFTATRVRETTVVIENGVAEDMLSAIMQFTGVPSLTGLPSLNVPCGFDADGLPVGMQLIGRPFDETTLFRVGAAFQSVTDVHTRGPAL